VGKVDGKKTDRVKDLGAKSSFCEQATVWNAL